MIENHSFTTPSGYSVVVKPHLTYGQSLVISETIAGNADMSTGAGLTLTNMHAANRKALEFLLVSVTDPQGQLIPSPVDAIMEMPQTDGEYVRDEIDRLTRGDGDPKAATTR